MLVNFARNQCTESVGFFTENARIFICSSDHIAKRKVVTTLDHIDPGLIMIMILVLYKGSILCR